MAANNAVWGIDIGQCSLKAIRCRASDTPGQLVAEAFDFIAYPKILSQPGAEPAELIRDALRQFLSRNSVQGCRVAISVPGQNGLARFIKLPPVESRKIPDIVRYEARQQIPFDLNDVIWDYQRMGGAEEEGFALETEVGLFAMKRDQVVRNLEPFDDVGIEVDVVQLTPLALYNFLLFDQMSGPRPAEEYDPDDPPASTVILSLGTDATDLVVTNGHRVWQRSIPLGGNHFTKALTKELKLTFAKAEHLKCNAASAPDPRALFQAMRPVFNDLLTEIQRSIGYFTSIDRHAKIERIVALGNAMKMPGLRRYLSQSLGLDVVRLESFERLAGAEVIGAPAFKENLLCFGVAYGLAVQGLNLGRGTLKTNLLPPEIVKDRFIRSKKPWALAAAAVVLLGCAIAYASNTLALNTVAESRFERAESDMKAAIGYSSQLKSDHDAAKAAFDEIAQTAQHLVGNVDNRVIWLELMRAINKSLPSDVGPGDPPQKRFSIPIEKRNEIHIESIVVQYVEDLSTWFTGVKDNYEPLSERMKAKFGGSEAAAAPVGAASEPMPSAPMPSDLGSELGGEISGMPAAPAEGGGLGPSGPGWVVQLNGYHYHNPKSADEGVGGEQYLKEEFLTRLEDNQLHFPAIGPQKIGPDGQEQKDVLVTMDELGIGYPVLIHCSRPEPEPLVDPSATSGDVGGAAGGLGGVAASASDKNAIIVNRTNFIVQFCWRPTPPTMRFEKKKEAEQREKDGLSRIDTEPF